MVKDAAPNGKSLIVYPRRRLTARRTDPSSMSARPICVPRPINLDRNVRRLTPLARPPD
jgi:hypothetical protein